MSVEGMTIQIRNGKAELFLDMINSDKVSYTEMITFNYANIINIADMDSLPTRIALESNISDKTFVQCIECSKLVLDFKGEKDNEMCISCSS